MDNRIIIIDGFSLIFRAYYAMNRPMITKDGIYTQGIFGFLNMLSKIEKEYESGYIAVAFDRSAPTFRHEKYEDYKAGRKKMPPELAMEIPFLKDILSAMNIKQLEMDGWEADDLIGTIAARAEEKGLTPLIITGDKDELQLATDKTSVLITKKGISEFDIYDKNTFIDKYGFTPTQFIDYKGLMGDSSDNYPGVPGIGEKGASKLILEYGSIDSIYENIDNMPKNKTTEKLIDGKASAYMSRELATINCNAPVSTEFEEFRWVEPDYEELVKIYTKLEFNSFLKKLDIPEKQEAIIEEDIEVDVVSGGEIKSILGDAADLVIKVLRNEEHIEKPEIYGIGFATDKLYYTSDVKAFIEAINERSITVSGHDIKNDLFALKHYGLDIPDVSFDTAIAEYVLDPSKSVYSLKNMSLEYLHRDVSETIEAGEQIDLFSDKTKDYAEFTGRWCKAVKNLRPVQEEKVKISGLGEVLYDIEIPLVAVLAEMEWHGISCDRNILDELGNEIKAKIDQLTSEIYELCGEEFNINSPMQLGNILFEKLGLPAGKKTKKGYSTSADVLNKIADKHEVIPMILEYRTLTKLNGTYVDGLVPLIGSDGRIHAHFQQTVTTTGRLSCTEPNLQNIPVRNDYGRLIRKSFVPADGFVFEGADYSQIELRVLAHMAGDEELIQAFNDGKDIHRITAAKVLGIPEDEITPAQRSSAKAVNFGVIYGMSGFGLSEELSISRKEAEKYIKDYFDRYVAVKEFMDQQVSLCRELGYVVTIVGRKRHINEIGASNFMVRQAGERLAMNSPIQGSAADIIKIAMIKVAKALKEAGLKSKLVLQIHDELIIETADDEKEIVKKLLQDNMESAYELKVKLIAEVNEGTDWYVLK